LLQNTFTLIPGFKEKQQRQLWKKGILTWDDFLQAEAIQGISALRKQEIDRQLQRFKYHLEQRDSVFFARKLPSGLHWLCYPAFGEEAVFLDIETSGTGRVHYITVIGAADRSGYQSLVREVNLNAARLKELLAPYKMVISFYGSGFDIPIMKKEFPFLPLYSLPHFDLCLCGKQIGLHGGLKKVEIQLGITRPQEVSGMGGYQAVILWDKYRRNEDHQALELLLRYNREDTCNLVQLAEMIFDRLQQDYLKVDGEA